MSVLIDFLLHPIVLVAFSIVSTAVVIGFSSPNSVVRPALFPIICVTTCLVVLTCKQRITNFSLASIVAGNGPTYLLAYLDFALLSKWDYPSRGPTASLARKDHFQKKVDSTPDFHSGTAAQRLYFGLHTVLSPRRVNTPYEVKNVPRFSADNPTYLPTPRKFLWRSVITAIICYTIVDLSSLGGSAPEENAVLFAQSKISFFTRLGSISIEDVAIRILSSLGVWLNVYCLTRMGHNVLAAVFVGTGISGVDAWRPPFGMFSEAYSVRQFWGQVHGFYTMSNLA